MTRSVILANDNHTILGDINRTSCQTWADAEGFTLQIDCNSTSEDNPLGSGADLLIAGDYQGAGEMWLRDTDLEWHFFSRELAIRDEMTKNTTLTGINGSLDLTNLNLSIQTLDGNTIVVNIDKVNKILDSYQDSIVLTEGTNSSPVFNQVFYTNQANPILSKHATLDENVPGVASYLMGNNFVYASIVGATTGEDFIKGVYNRFLDDGAIYKSGFDISANTSELNISTGTMKILLKTLTLTKEHSTSDLVIEINSSGHFDQHINNLDGFNIYATGESISNNKYFNLVCGIVFTNDMEGRLFCVVQDKPATEHTGVTQAETDESHVNFFPSDSIVQKAYIPIARIIIQNTPGGNVIQVVDDDGNLFIDLRGQAIGTGGSPPTFGDNLGNHILTQNLVGDNFNATFDYCNANTGNFTNVIATNMVTTPMVKSGSSEIDVANGMLSIGGGVRIDYLKGLLKATNGAVILDFNDDGLANFSGNDIITSGGVNASYFNGTFYGDGSRLTGVGDVFNNTDGGYNFSMDSSHNWTTTGTGTFTTGSSSATIQGIGSVFQTAGNTRKVTLTDLTWAIDTIGDSRFQNLLVEEANDGGDTNIIIRNSAASGSTDETTSLIFKTATHLTAIIESYRIGDYLIAEDYGGLKFYVGGIFSSENLAIDISQTMGGDITTNFTDDVVVGGDMEGDGYVSSAEIGNQHDATIHTTTIWGHDNGGGFENLIMTWNPSWITWSSSTGISLQEFNMDFKISDDGAFIWGTSQDFLVQYDAGTDDLVWTHSNKNLANTLMTLNKDGDITGEGNLIVKDAIAVGTNTLSGLSSGDINASTVYTDASGGHSPFMILPDPEVNYTRLCVYDKLRFWNLVWWENGIEQSQVNSKRCNDKAEGRDIKKENEATCKSNNYSWDGECYEIVKNPTDYDGAIESYDNPIMESYECLKLGNQLQEVSSSCERESGETEIVYRRKEGCDWNEDLGYYCEERVSRNSEIGVGL